MTCTVVHYNHWHCCLEEHPDTPDEHYMLYADVLSYAV